MAPPGMGRSGFVHIFCFCRCLPRRSGPPLASSRSRSKPPPLLHSYPLQSLRGRMRSYCSECKKIFKKFFAGPMLMAQRRAVKRVLCRRWLRPCTCSLRCAHETLRPISLPRIDRTYSAAKYAGTPAVRGSPCHPGSTAARAAFDRCQVPPVYRYACGTIQVFSGASF